ncbi:ArsR/SmtB family transcription factor [Natronogracilivirga saccharolytica]|uniref:Winged helix-turn-helix transcriptional regulator n=1 Tax=Natronogracilivirga saccharolytica TaxID=2812953 RepID=A0A8J7RUQ8_9BACT|nr:metalloregulator ArsR/SmtB family transcription factor [Natronogracilivirga saccharolytica]MBP3193317.1 winged helix-turn-helix transcriptional regulator [Natronogracilivirga saccharolytica]
MPAISSKLRARILQAIAHPNRIRILEAVRKGLTCSCEIAPQLDMEQSNLSRHMKILVDSGILTPQRDGVRINYRVADEEVFQLLDLSGRIVRNAAERSIHETEF